MYFKVIGMRKQRSIEEKSFSMILKLEVILLVVFYERKNIIFHLKNVKLMINNTFDDVFL